VRVDIPLPFSPRDLRQLAALRTYGEELQVTSFGKRKEQDFVPLRGERGIDQVCARLVELPCLPGSGIGERDDIAVSSVGVDDPTTVAGDLRVCILTRTHQHRFGLSACDGHFPQRQPCFNYGCPQRQTTEEEANGIAIDASGRIVVAGRMRYIAWSPYDSEEPYYFWGAFMVFRYLPNGTLDSSFSDDVSSNEDGWTYLFETGYLSSAQTLPTSAALAVTIDKNEKIVVAGYAVSGNGIASFALARLLSNGNLDSTFAGDGKDTITNWGWHPASAGAIKVDGAGNILAAGSAQTANARFALARWLPDGALDTAFGDDGRVLTDFCQANEGIKAIATPRLYPRSPDRRIVVAGWAEGDPLP
jgi:uncharacterized delta-60 repeat protein